MLFYPRYDILKYEAITTYGTILLTIVFTSLLLSVVCPVACCFEWLAERRKGGYYVLSLILYGLY